MGAVRQPAHTSAGTLCLPWGYEQTLCFSSDGLQPDGDAQGGSWQGLRDLLLLHHHGVASLGVIAHPQCHCALVQSPGVPHSIASINRDHSPVPALSLHCHCLLFCPPGVGVVSCLPP